MDVFASLWLWETRCWPEEIRYAIFLFTLWKKKKKWYVIVLELSRPEKPGGAQFRGNDTYGNAKSYGWLETNPGRRQPQRQRKLMPPPLIIY